MQAPQHRQRASAGPCLRTFVFAERRAPSRRFAQSTARLVGAMVNIERTAARTSRRPVSEVDALLAERLALLHVEAAGIDRPLSGRRPGILHDQDLATGR